MQQVIALNTNHVLSHLYQTLLVALLVVVIGVKQFNDNFAAPSVWSLLVRSIRHVCLAAA